MITVEVATTASAATPITGIKFSPVVTCVLEVLPPPAVDVLLLVVALPPVLVLPDVDAVLFVPLPVLVSVSLASAPIVKLLIVNALSATSSGVLE